MNPTASFLSNNHPSNGDEFAQIAPDLQGNILKGHGRSHLSLVFFTFEAGGDKQQEAKKWLREFGTHYLTSAEKQKEDTLSFNQTGQESPFFGLYLTAKGFKYLNKEVPSDAAFKEGMKGRKDILKDLPCEDWGDKFKLDTHGYVLIAFGSEEERPSLLNLYEGFIVEQLKNLGATVFTEQGDGIKNDVGDDIEHFGYVDGVSQPIFFSDSKALNTVQNWNPLRNWATVLVEYPQNSGQYGSYLVFRKLEQDVKAFKINEAKLGFDSRPPLFGEAAEIVGAEIVGRFEAGMPIELSDEADSIAGSRIDERDLAGINDFNYQKNKCPFHAHIRRTNERTAEFPMIARRGIIYGKRTKENLENPIDVPIDKEVGLLFQCFQSDIAKQFEAIQQNANKKGNEDGKIDEIIGCPSKNRFVKLIGGDYFFAPSLSFFKNL